MVGCIIGSFRKYYDDILNVIQTLESNGHIILSPKKSNIIDNRNGFVVLQSDNSSYSDVDIETVVFHRIFSSDYVYVWNPHGYIGKTTCYEIGRIVEKRIPLYFLTNPKDVPIYIPNGSIISIKEFIKYINENNRLPPLSETNNPVTFTLINNLKNGHYTIE